VKREDVVVRSGSALACTPASLLTQTAFCVRAAQPGQMVRPQFASRESSLDSLLHSMRGKECARTLSRRVQLCGLHHQCSDALSLLLLRLTRYIAELKFDGERIQLHKDGDKARPGCFCVLGAALRLGC
jgi:hypothetical protein